MKKILLLLAFCFSLITVYGQKLVAVPSDDGDFYEVSIHDFDSQFGKQFEQERLAALSPEKAEEREVWRKECADKLLTPEIMKQFDVAMKKDAGLCLLTFYFNEEGKVLTVKFNMSASVYVRFSKKMLRELYNKAIEEAVLPEWYEFKEGKTFAIDAVELIQRYTTKE